MTTNSIHHGLSVYTGADDDNRANTADNRRLRRPVAEIVTNTFNDAFTGDLYDHPAGHEGIDFDCEVGTVVRAMYGGVVFKVVNQYKAGQGEIYGNLVRIRSCTDPVTGAGFEHTYAHLQYREPDQIIVTEGMTVAKGDQIGVSGDTGAGARHLHVHVKAFGANGTVTSEHKPSWTGTEDRKKYTDVASRIYGCLNFACFLPPDAKSYAPAIDSDSFPPESGRRLLSPRKVTLPNIPVYDNYSNGQLHPVYVTGREIACYAVLGQHPKDSAEPDWYKIRHSELNSQGLPNGNTIEGWVSRTTLVEVRAPGTNSEDDKGLSLAVPWVQVEEASTTEARVQTHPHFVTPEVQGANDYVDLHARPSLDANKAGRLDAGRCCAVVGKWKAAANVPEANRRWWQVRCKEEDGSILVGWVEGNKVWLYGDEIQVPTLAGPATALRVAPGTPYIQEPSVVEESVTVSWTAREESSPVTGYVIWRGPSPENLAEVHRVKTRITSWTDQPTTSLGTLYYYAVSAYRDEVQGERSPAVGAITGHGTLSGSKVLVVAEANTDIQPTPNTGSTALASLPALTALRFYEPKGVLWLNKAPVSLAVEVPATGTSASGTGGASGTTVREGWVPASAVKVLDADGTLATTTSPAGRRRLAAVAARSYLRLRSWVTGLNLRTGPSTAFAVHALLTDTNAWYAVTGKTATTPVWYRLRYSDTFQGWVHGDYVTLSESAPAVTAVTPPAEPAVPTPTNRAGTGMETTTGSASGDFRNLVTNPDGRWVVDKSGTTVTANFGSPRSPIQYYARQDPQPQFVLPAGFRPTATVTHTVTGSQVDKNRKPVPNAPRVSFDLTIGTNGEMRYVNNRKVDHLGYVSYNVTGLTWRSNETLTVPAAPAQPGDIEASGVYLNQQENWGSSWELERRGNAVSGSFGSTRSPVDYFANGAHRAAQLLLPKDYRPKANARFQVKGAVRVNVDGSDSTDTRKVDFWLTVQPNGEMWYDADSNLQTLGVGHLRYTVNVSWTAAPRITVPGIPRALEAEDIEATELELDWSRPAKDGGASVDGYRIQVWDADEEEWDTEESNTNSTRTRYDVEALEPYTTYRFRVAAHNRAGWGAFCPAVIATTRRRAPGRPASLSATAAHDAVTLSWGRASGTVTGYRIERRTGNGPWEPRVDDTGTTTRSFVDRRVSASTTYRYRVAAHNRGQAGPWSRERSATTAAAPTIPGQVANLAVAPGTGSRLQLTWTAPTDTGGGVTGYRVERSPDTTPRTWTVVRADTGSATASWGDNEVAAATVYRYRVSARNSAGIGTPSAEAQGRARPQLRLGGRLPYPLTAHAAPWADAPATATWNAYLPGRSYDLAGQATGEDAWWRVLLFDRDTPGPFWLPATAGTVQGSTAALPQPPAAPQNLVATLARGRVTLTWSAPPAGTVFTGQRLWRQRDAEAWTQLGDDLGAAVRTRVDGTVANGHVYRYRLQTLADTGPGRPSDPAALAVMANPAAPAAVTGLQAAATTTTLQLGWTRAATGGLPVAYRVQWRVANNAADFRETTVDGTAHTLTGLLPGTTYALRVTAFNQVGDAPATGHTATTVQVAPGVPETLTLTVSGQEVTAFWQPPLTGGPPDAYHLQYKPQATLAWPAAYTTIKELSHVLPELGYGMAYDLRVRAANTAGISTWVTASATTAAQPVPGMPTDLTAAPGAASQMVLAWTAPTTGGPVAGYRIERAAAADPLVWTEAIADTGGTAATWSDGGLPADTVHHYRVTARNAGGPGTPSATAQGRTRPQGALQAGATYPLTAHRWPAAEAPATHTWAAHDATAALDVVGRVAGADGWWRVLRFGHADDGPYWLPAAATTVTGNTAAVPQAPGIPGTPTATATDASATLTWTAPATGGTVTGYRLWRRSGEATVFSVLGTDLAATALTHTDTTVATGTAYAYRVQALSAAGAGPRSAAVAVTAVTLQVPGTPTGLTAAPGADSQMQLQWTAPTAGGPVAGYRIERSADATPRVWTAVAADTGTADTTWADTDLAAYTVYHYRVTALNAGGLGAPSATAQGRTRPRGLLSPHFGTYPLTAHAWPEATAPTTHTWQASDVPADHDLVAQRRRDGHWYRLLRFGHADAGPYWVPAVALATAGGGPLPAVPEAPRRLTLWAVTHAWVVLAWRAPVRGGPVSGYRLWRRTGRTGPFTRLGPDLAATVRRHEDATVAAGTVYEYRVQALADAAGAGPRTAALRVSVPTAP